MSNAEQREVVVSDVRLPWRGGVLLWLARQADAYGCERLARRLTLRAFLTQPALRGAEVTHHTLECEECDDDSRRGES